MEGELVGTFYTMLWHAPLTGNEGFVRANETMKDTRTGAKLVARNLAGRMAQMYGLQSTGRLLRVKLPEDKEKFVLYDVEEGGAVLPFACTKGPMFDKQRQEQKEKDE